MENRRKRRRRRNAVEWLESAFRRVFLLPRFYRQPSSININGVCPLWRIHGLCPVLCLSTSMCITLKFYNYSYFSLIFIVHFLCVVYFSSFLLKKERKGINWWRIEKERKKEWNPFLTMDDRKATTTNDDDGHPKMGVWSSILARSWQTHTLHAQSTPFLLYKHARGRAGGLAREVFVGNSRIKSRDQPEYQVDYR